MLWLLATLFATPAHADEMTVKVRADATAVMLDCGLETFSKTAGQGTRNADGTVSYTFPVHPGKACTLSMTHPVTQIEQIGTWQCDPSNCVRLDGGSGPVVTAPGEIKVFWKEKTSHNMLELTCDSGYRARSEMSNFEASFSAVPDGDDCTLNWKGGAPMKYRPLTPGAWECRLVQSTPVCTKL